MRTVQITLPGIPPSLNAFAGRANAWDYRASKKKWTEAVLWTLKKRGIRLPEPFERAHVTVCYFFPDRRRHDPDNYCGKLLMDGLTRGGIIADDDFRHITLTLAGEVDRDNPRTEITVQER